jgi:hypothetical protein
MCFFLFRLRRDAVVPAQDLGPGQSPARLDVRLRLGRRSPGKCLWRPHALHGETSSVGLRLNWRPSFCFTALELPQHRKESIVVSAVWWPRNRGLSLSNVKYLSFHYSVQTGIASLVSKGYREGGGFSGRWNGRSVNLAYIFNLVPTLGMYGVIPPLLKRLQDLVLNYTYG